MTEPATAKRPWYGSDRVVHNAMIRTHRTSVASLRARAHRSALLGCIVGWMASAHAEPARPEASRESEASRKVAPEAPRAGQPASSPTPTPEAKAEIVVWPTLTPAGDHAASIEPHRPVPKEGEVFVRAQELDATLHDAVQDLGYALDLADAGPRQGRARDLDMIERASRSGARGNLEGGAWVISPRLEPAGASRYVLRIVAVPPKGQELRVRTEDVGGEDVAVRGLVMLRNLLSLTTAAQAAAEERERIEVQASADLGIMSAIRSPGRAVLATNGALFGAFSAYSIHRGSGSDDPRLLYPLLALGTGVGLGGTLLVAEEWDVSTGDAWYLSAGAWWGVSAGMLIATGRDVQPASDRFSWGVGGGLLGVALSTYGLTRRKMDEGGAVLTHSGGALGLFFGGLAELAERGTTKRTPYTGSGYGSAIGLVGAGALATFVRTSPSRVLLVDLGVGLGALGGAAAGSPLIFDELTESKTRGFIAASAGGALLGGALAWWFTRDRAPDPDKAAASSMPFVGVVGQSLDARGVSIPAYGAGYTGSW